MPMAMTAHVIYSAIDPKRPATTSKKAIRKIIRGSLGFDGLVMSDDLSMKALSGDFAERAEQSLAAGCDVVLHCNGDMAEMNAVVDGTGALKGHAKRRAAAALGRIARAPEPLDLDAARARFAAALGTG
jgi:beta-N-acetylhexosaminidase